jgi:outer membrane lipoprotein carrier protein
MNARTLILAGLGGLLLMAALLLTFGPEDGSVSAPSIAAERMGGDADRTPGPPAGPEPAWPDPESISGPAPEDRGAAVSGRMVEEVGPVEPVTRTAKVPAPGMAPGAGEKPDAPGREADGGLDAAAADAPVADAPISDAGAPAAQEEVEAILRATARRYEGVRSLQADFQQRLTNTLLGRTTESSGTLYQRQPDRFLMRFSEPAGDVIVSDGEFFWLYYPSVDPKQVIRSERGAGGLDLRSQFVGDPVRRFEATSHGTERVRGRDTHVLTLTPREPMGYRRLKVWIDADDHLVRRFELTEVNGNVRRFELTDLRVNPTLEDALFRFEPPAGAVVVTRG